MVADRNSFMEVTSLIAVGRPPERLAKFTCCRSLIELRVELVAVSPDSFTLDVWLSAAKGTTTTFFFADSVLIEILHAMFQVKETFEKTGEQEPIKLLYYKVIK